MYAKSKTGVKKLLRLGLILFTTLLLFVAVILFCGIFNGGGFSGGENTESSLDLNENPSVRNAAQSLSSIEEITNVVIFICFADENVNAVRNSIIAANIRDQLNGDVSMRSYFEEISFGNLNVQSVFPSSGSSLFVYQASQSRSYYGGNLSDPVRRTRESSLLNAAVSEAATKFDFSGMTLDSNGDELVDSVSFIVSGSHRDPQDWGLMLWPHTWKLNSISGGNAQKINGIRVNDYTFTFIESFKLGLNCHEFGHVLGLPDLYHYNNNTERLPAGPWDLMHNEQSNPQYVTTHLRQRYLGYVSDFQVQTISAGGEYTLTAVSVAGAGTILAQKIEISATESIWIEYRSNGAGKFDADLPGSGLIVYRVNTSVSGNENGKYRNTSYPDELYIYRPSIGPEPKASATNEIKNWEATNLAYAYLNTNNPYFSSLGDAFSTSKYDSRAIYLTDGTNTGIVITPRAQTPTSMTFEVDLGLYDTTTVEEVRVVGGYTMLYGETPRPTVEIKYKNTNAFVAAVIYKYQIIYNPDILGTQTATVIYNTGEVNPPQTTFELTINDGVVAGSQEIVSPPDKTYYQLNETISLAGLVFKVTFLYAGEKQFNWLQHQFQIAGVDMSKAGTYSMEVTVFELKITLPRININVNAELQSIRVSDVDSITVVTYGVSPSLNVEALLADGSYARLNPLTDYSVSRHNAIDYYVPQVLTVTLTSNPSIKTTVTIYVVKDVELTNAEITVLPKTEYGFGESLDLTGGQITFTYASNTVSVPLANYYSRFNDNYDSLHAGMQSLSVGFRNNYSVPATLRVTVASLSNSILTSTASDIIINNKSIVIKREMSLSYFAAQLSTYLSIRIFNGDLEVTVGTYPDIKVRNGFVIKVLNSYGTEIDEFSVILLGDADYNGVLNENDRNEWLIALFNNQYAIYLDASGDGYYTLADFVILNDLLLAVAK